MSSGYKIMSYKCIISTESLCIDLVKRFTSHISIAIS